MVTGESVRHRSRARGLIVAALVVISLLLGGRYVLLFIGATEGDIPSSSSLPLPVGTEIVSEQSDCASGGCWLELTVRPPRGTSPQELAEQMGADPQLEISGNLLDPRTIWVWAEPGNSLLTLRADYFSQRWVP